MTEKSKRYPTDARLFALILTSNAIIGFLLGNSNYSVTTISPSSSPTSVLPTSVPAAAPRDVLLSSSTTDDDEVFHLVTQKPSYQGRHRAKEDDANDDANTMSQQPPSSLKEQKTGAEQPFEEQLGIEVGNLPFTYLTDKDRLVATVTSVMSDMDLDVHSSEHYCHDDKVSGGVSCAGLYTDGHSILHTTPNEGLLTIDIVNIGPVLELYKVVEDVVKKHLPRSDGVDNNVTTAPTVKWGHQVRGHIPNNKLSSSSSSSSMGHLRPLSDLVNDVIKPIEMYSKKQVASVTTEFRRVDIWDVLDVGQEPDYFDGLKGGLKMTGHDERWKMTEYTSPDRSLFIDGQVKSEPRKDAACHEARVHPGMFSHPHPTTVAIIGQGDTAVLREVLKHDTVRSVKMIEPDTTLMNVVKEHFPFHTDCSAIVGSAPNCYDDPRVEVIAQDPFAWFSAARDDADLLFDVIIAEATALSSGVDDRNTYLTSLYQTLNKNDGILIIHAGTSLHLHQPWQRYDSKPLIHDTVSLLETHPTTAAVIAYEDTECGLNNAEAFILACVDARCRESWYAESSLFDDKVRRRMSTRPLTGRDAAVHHQPTALLKSYDGNTHRSYQHLSKPWEVVYCRREPTPFECEFVHGFSTGKMGGTIHELGATGGNSSLVLRWWKYDESGDLEMGIFATRSIKKGDWIMSQDTTSSISVPTRFVQMLEEQRHNVTMAKDLWEYVREYGHHVGNAGSDGVAKTEEGIDSVIVETGNGALFGNVDSQNEANVERLRSYLMTSYYGDGRDEYETTTTRPVFSPVFDRRRLLLDTIVVASRDIEEGEEILIYQNSFSGNRS